jgi:hypothetical protein
MAKGRAVEIILTDAEKRELTALTRKHGAPQALADRARIVLAAAGGLDPVPAIYPSARLPSTPLQRPWHWPATSGSIHRAREDEVVRVADLPIRTLALAARWGDFWMAWRPW